MNKADGLKFTVSIVIILKNLLSLGLKKNILCNGRIATLHSGSNVVITASNFSICVSQELKARFSSTWSEVLIILS